MPVSNNETLISLSSFAAEVSETTTLDKIIELFQKKETAPGNGRPYIVNLKSIKKEQYSASTNWNIL